MGVVFWRQDHCYGIAVAEIRVFWVFGADLYEGEGLRWKFYWVSLFFYFFYFKIDLIMRLYLKLFFNMYLLFFIIFNGNVTQAQLLSCEPQGSQFQLHMLNKSHKYYEHNNSGDISILDKISVADDSVFCITNNDISFYDWTTQSIFFTESFLLRFANLKNSKDRQKTSAASFVITLYDEKLYYGAIDKGYSSGYSIPTLFMKFTDREPFIVIRPLDTFNSNMKSYSQLDTATKNIIEKQEIYDFFLKLNKLVYSDDPACVEGWLPSKACNLSKFKKEKNEINYFLDN